MARMGHASPRAALIYQHTDHGITGAIDKGRAGGSAQAEQLSG
jgi:hypothetical protein